MHPPPFRQGFASQGSVVVSPPPAGGGGGVVTTAVQLSSLKPDGGSNTVPLVVLPAGQLKLYLALSLLQPNLQFPPGGTSSQSPLIV